MISIWKITIRIYFKTVYIARLKHAVLIFGLLRYLNINFGVLHWNSFKTRQLFSIKIWQISISS